jgi:carbon-monoxide dehydrogenase medium subunit
VEIPVPVAGSVSGFSELVRRHGDYAIVGLAAQGIRSGGKWSSLKLCYFGVGDKPVLAEAAASALVSGKNIADAQATLDRDLSPNGDGESSAATQKQLARVMLARVIGSMD